MYKQVIIVRKDLNMRKGKMIAQGCHASLKAYLDTHQADILEWEEEGSTKIAVSVNSEKELKEIYSKAKEFGLPCSLILDAAKTEFKVPTYTSCAIGPASETVINIITGNLSLL